MSTQGDIYRDRGTDSERERYNTDVEIEVETVREREIQHRYRDRGRDCEIEVQADMGIVKVLVNDWSKVNNFRFNEKRNHFLFNHSFRPPSRKFRPYRFNETIYLLFFKYFLFI
jgi:hypothetical protein